MPRCSQKRVPYAALLELLSKKKNTQQRQCGTDGTRASVGGQDV
jgi:hypothetical protein